MSRTKLYCQVTVTKSTTYLHVWNTQKRWKTTLGSNSTEEIGKVLKSLKEKYSIQMRSNQPLAKDAMVALTQVVRMVGHTIAF